MSQQVGSMHAHDLIEKLKEEGLKVTTPRQALIESLLLFTQPFTADDVVTKLSLVGHHVHRATVYRDLTLFVHAGLLRELSIHGVQAHYYELTGQDHHHHFICQNCLSIQDITPDQVERALTRYESQLRAQGLQVNFHQLKIYGTCQMCQTGKSHAD